MKVREMRKSPRILSENLISVRPLAGEVGAETLTTSKVVSLGGIMFESKSRFRKGQKLELILLAGVDLLRTVVKVKWCGKGESGLWQVGVEFQEFSEEEQIKLLDTLMRRICLREATES